MLTIAYRRNLCNISTFRYDTEQYQPYYYSDFCRSSFADRIDGGQTDPSQRSPISFYATDRWERRCPFVRSMPHGGVPSHFWDPHLPFTPRARFTGSHWAGTCSSASFSVCSASLCGSKAVCGTTVLLLIFFTINITPALWI